MAICRYRRWALIAVDANPIETGPTVYSPPMLSAVALGGGSSLVFELDPPTASLEVRLVTTALTSEDRPPDCLRVFTGSEPDTYVELRVGEWDRTVEGLHATFAARLTSAKRFVKLLSSTAPDLIVTGIAFEAP